jgi:hypothetical protein
MLQKKTTFIPNQLKPWIDALQRFRLSHAHVQMAFELGLNLKKLGKLANHHQEPWKLPLPIAKLYLKRLGKTAADAVRTIEQKAAAQAAKKRAKKLRKAVSGSNALKHGSDTGGGEKWEKETNGIDAPTIPMITNNPNVARERSAAPRGKN